MEDLAELNRRECQVSAYARRPTQLDAIKEHIMTQTASSDYSYIMRLSCDYHVTSLCLSCDYHVMVM